MTREVVEIYPRMKVRWKHKCAGSQNGIVQSIFVDAKNPKRAGIEVEIKWNDGAVLTYNALDFAEDGDIEIV